MVAKGRNNQFLGVELLPCYPICLYQKTNYIIRYGVSPVDASAYQSGHQCWTVPTTEPEQVGILRLLRVWKSWNGRQPWLCLTAQGTSRVERQQASHRELWDRTLLPSGSGIADHQMLVLQIPGVIQPKLRRNMKKLIISFFKYT